MKIIADRLAQAKARPLLVENAVRVALRDAIGWRIGGGAAPRADAFIAAAVASARQVLDLDQHDSTDRSRTLAAVEAAARRFAASALCKRLMTVPASQLLRSAPGTQGPDAIVRDKRRHLHAIALRFSPDAFDAGRAATLVASATFVATADRLSPVTVHVFSLTSGHRHSFQRDVRITARQVRVA